MTVEAPAHILPRLRDGDPHLADIAMTGFAAHSSIDMPVMWEMDKIGLDGNRNPGNGSLLRT
jgi:hypothetical protein